MRIFLTGFMGSGKSYTGKRLAALVSLPFFDLDAEIEAGEKVSISDIFAQHGETHFRDLEHKYLKEIIAQNKNCIVSTGGGTPCFSNNAELLLQSGMVIYLETNPKILAKRLQKESNNRPLIKGKSLVELEDFINKKVTARLPYYEKAHVVVRQQIDNQDVASELQKAMSQLIGH